MKIHVSTRKRSDGERNVSLTMRGTDAEIGTLVAQLKRAVISPASMLGEAIAKAVWPER